MSPLRKVVMWKKTQFSGLIKLILSSKDFSKSRCHPREGGDPGRYVQNLSFAWIPAFAGMTLQKPTFRSRLSYGIFKVKTVAFSPDFEAVPESWSPNQEWAENLRSHMTLPNCCRLRMEKWKIDVNLRMTKRQVLWWKGRSWYEMDKPGTSGPGWPMLLPTGQWWFWGNCGIREW